MSEPKLISPLLDGYSMGSPISDHDGVCCAPAMKENSDSKYIVKVISIPASQVQLDALLLTGAYKDAASAMDYFKELSEGVAAEAKCLSKLAKLEGFLPYEGWQVVPMEKNQLGYHVYLVGSYKRSLDKYMSRHNMTHLGAVNLGLDLCAALAIARRAGWMYVDVKPSNIFISEEKEYRIGDLGFVRLDSLKYTSLPRKYCSPYSAPEVRDAMSTLNDTVDTYAVGMLLYQIYNNGQLPPEDYPAEEPLPAPANADYELAEIILKACAPEPKDRWENPIAMGQELVAYMQRNEVNDVDIMPPVVPLGEKPPAKPKKVIRDDTAPSEEDAQAVDQASLSEEMHTMISQADDLAAHDAPEPVVVPEPTPVDQLTPVQPEPETEEVPAEPAETAEPAAEAEAEDKPQESETAPETSEEGDYPDLDSRRRGAKGKAKAKSAVAVLLLLLLVVGGILFYRNYYLLTINELQVAGSENSLTVLLDTEIDSSLLTVVCTDTYGNTVEAPVVDNQAVFTDLLPDMLYKIRVEVSGFHGLDGSTTHEFTTQAETNIVSFTAVVGSEDGSAILSFTVDGPETQDWIITYSAEGEIEQSLSFTGHTVPISGLTVGKTYTFTLLPGTDLYMVGQDTITFTASKIVLAEDLQVSTSTEGSLTVNWSTPEDAQVQQWTVHCYSSDGYDKTLTTAENTATFDGISTGSAYTVEVTAEGMTQTARTSITANPVQITSIQVDESDVTQLTVSWDYQGDAPEGGWLLLYTIDDSDMTQMVQCDTNSAVIEVRVPGATYSLSIQAADGSSVFSQDYTYECPNAEVYEDTENYFYARDLSVHLLKTPSKSNWSYKDVSSSNYTSTFASGDGISILLHSSGKFYLPNMDITILYVIRDSDGNVLTDLIGREIQDWRDMWRNTDYHYCELDIPAVPTEPGEYNLCLYFNGYAITSVDFTITE